MRSPASHQTKFIAPFLVFMGLLAGVDLLDHFLEGEGPFWISQPKYWIYPLQTLLCGALLWLWRRDYRLKAPSRPGWTSLIAAAVFLLWISPQTFFSSPQRLEGFDPTVFDAVSARLATLALRLLRLVVVVPLLEEIFWRGFLLRYLVRPDFGNVPFGTFTWPSFLGVTAAFGLAHWGPDFLPALITGALYNLVAYRTGNLSSCVLAHALTNLFLGVYILATRQWGFW